MENLVIIKAWLKKRLEQYQFKRALETESLNISEQTKREFKRQRNNLSDEMKNFIQYAFSNEDTEQWKKP